MSFPQRRINGPLKSIPSTGYLGLNGTDPRPRISSGIEILPWKTAIDRFINLQEFPCTAITSETEGASIADGPLLATRSSIIQCTLSCT